jgi:hypothetical protein
MPEGGRIPSGRAESPVGVDAGLSSEVSKSRSRPRSASGGDQKSRRDRERPQTRPRELLRLCADRSRGRAISPVLRVGAENSVRAFARGSIPALIGYPVHAASRSSARTVFVARARARIPDRFELGKVNGLAPEACERRIRGAAGYAAILYSRSKPPSRSRRRRRLSCGDSARGAGSSIGGLASGGR